MDTSLEISGLELQQTLEFVNSDAENSIFGCEFDSSHCHIQQPKNVAAIGSTFCRIKSEVWWTVERQVDSFEHQCEEGFLLRSQKRERKTNNLVADLISKLVQSKQLKNASYGTKESLLAWKAEIEETIRKARERLSQSSGRLDNLEAQASALELRKNAIESSTKKDLQEWEYLREHLGQAVRMYGVDMGLKVVAIPGQRQLRIEFTHVDPASPTRVCVIVVEGNGKPDFKILQSDPQLSGLADLEATLTATQDFQAFLCRVRRLFSQSFSHKRK